MFFMSRVDCLRMGSDNKASCHQKLQCFKSKSLFYIFIHNTTVVYSRSYSDQFIVYREKEASGTAAGAKKQSGVIFKCLVEGQIQQFQWRTEGRQSSCDKGKAQPTSGTLSDHCHLLFCASSLTVCLSEGHKNCQMFFDLLLS